MNDLFLSIKKQVQRHKPSIVFPESLDERILNAVCRLSHEGVLTPILIGNKTEILTKVSKLGFKTSELIIYNPAETPFFSELLIAFVERRQHKVSREEARKLLLDKNYFGTMLVYVEKADGFVSGATHSTAKTVQPALQIIKTKQGVNKASGAFLMIKGKQKYLFADCAINISPSVEDLAEIALTTAETARIFDIDPKVAMLSFSTKGSASGAEVKKVIAATEIAKKRAPHLILDGEIQFDAAFVSEVAAKKAPDSLLQGKANVFIFPNIEAGNICYKMVQRLADFEAIGPILQGLNQPVNDLSRGCSVEDVYKVSLITAMQALISKLPRKKALLQ